MMMLTMKTLHSQKNLRKTIHIELLQNNFKFIDLFAGIGGFRIALEKFGGKCVFSSEWDKHAQTTYKTNFGDEPKGDITKIKEESIPSHDVLCAGFPCQPFSISGKKLGFQDIRGTLFFDVARIVGFHKPKVVFLENVKHFATHDNGNTRQVVIDVLKSLKYDVYDNILNTSDFGIPQSRKRYYLLAFKKNLKIKNFEFPTPTYKKVSLKEFLQTNSKAKNQEISKGEIKIFQDMDERIMAKKEKRSPIRIGTINGGGQGERIYSPEGHAITLSAHGGGIASKTGAYLIDGVIRKLTPSECCQIMGFPKDFKIEVSDSQAYKQFGNSVVVPVIEQIFDKVLTSMIFNDP
jgi:DNA (cytosine-5)-methyltransferase 1